MDNLHSVNYDRRVFEQAAFETIMHGWYERYVQAYEYAKSRGILETDMLTAYIRACANTVDKPFWDFRGVFLPDYKAPAGIVNINATDLFHRLCDAAEMNDRLQYLKIIAQLKYNGARDVDIRNAYNEGTLKRRERRLPFVSFDWMGLER